MPKVSSMKWQEKVNSIKMRTSLYKSTVSNPMPVLYYNAIFHLITFLLLLYLIYKIETVKFKKKSFLFLIIFLLVFYNRMLTYFLTQ